MNEMKTHFLFLLIALLFSVFLMSCSSPQLDEEVSPEVSIPSIQIGNQIWMAHNLAVTHYQNGDPIVLLEPDEYWRQTTDGAWCYYNNDSVNFHQYGKLYNWYAINDQRGICPDGWRIPTKTDWMELIEFSGGDSLAGGTLKQPELWERLHDDAADQFNFSAKPSGYRLTSGEFLNHGIITVFWTADKADQNNAWDIFIISKSPIAGISQTGAEHGFSCRCIKEK
jgi:uncharacterized protein (TIGR02145 family)